MLRDLSIAHDQTGELFFQLLLETAELDVFNPVDNSCYQYDDKHDQHDPHAVEVHVLLSRIIWPNTTVLNFRKHS